MNSKFVSRVRLFGVFALAATFLLGGCGDLRESPVSSDLNQLPHRTAEQSIREGDVDENNTAVVGMTVERDRGFGICTGTLITRNLVLTAQHCVAELNTGGGVDCAETEFTEVLDPTDIGVTNDTAIGRQTDFRLGEEIITPDSDQICGADIALIRLSRNFDPDEVTPRTPQLEQTPARGDDYTAIGYGATGRNEEGRSGVRRIREGRRVFCLGQGCPEGASEFVKEGEFVGNGGTCQGDSGGGAYAPDGKVFGTLSRGGGNCQSSLYTSVPNWSRMIRMEAEEAAEKGGYEPPPWVSTGGDPDGDGVGSEFDNCPETPNPEQLDTDGDGQGDACDSDSDGDGVPDTADNCPKTPNPEQRDLSGNGVGNACTDDIDGDGVDDEADTCPELANPEQRTSENGECRDSDGDGIADVADNCPETPNPEQRDPDGDGVGAKCDSDENVDDPSSGDGEDEITPRPTPVSNSDSGCSAAGREAPVGFGAVVFVVGVFAAGRRSRYRRSD